MSITSTQSVNVFLNDCCVDCGDGDDEGDDEEVEDTRGLIKSWSSMSTLSGEELHEQRQSPDIDYEVVGDSDAGTECLSSDEGFALQCRPMSLVHQYRMLYSASVVWRLFWK